MIRLVCLLVCLLMSGGGDVIPVAVMAEEDGTDASASASRPASQQSQTVDLPKEPAEYDDRELDAYYDWRNNMFFRLFDMEEAGVATFMTARRTYKVWENQFGSPVVITVANPVFYWMDRNGNGEFEPDQGEMWSDPYEDGVNGNERPYDVSDLQSPESTIPIWEAPMPK